MLAVLMLPGWAAIGITRLRYKEQPQRALSPFLLCISLSYALFASVVFLARTLQFSYEQFSGLIWAYLMITGFIAVSLQVKTWLGKQYKHNQLIDLSTWLVSNGLIVTIVILLAAYQLIFGAYTEIPADIYFHIEKFQQILAIFFDNELKPISSITTVIKQDAEVWYHLLAWLAASSSASVAQMLQTVNLLSQSIFLLAVYAFAMHIFKSRTRVHLIASLAVLLVAIHYGVSVFSFVRYYSLAPAMLGFVFYFTAIIVILNVLQLRTFTGLVPNSLLWLLMLIAAILVHTQEAMFIAIQSCIILCLFALALFRKSSLIVLESVFTASDQSSKYFDLMVKLLAGAVVMVFGLAYVFAHYRLVHYGNFGDRLLELGPSIGILPKLAILNPGFQFIQVVTLWGVLVYVLFFVHWQRYKQNLLLVSGMLVPVCTIFNPFFTDLFLRITDSTVLWRFCFLIPIHYVAADLIVLYLQRVFVRDGGVVWKKATASLVLLALFVLLLPFKNGWQGLHHSRYPTWRAVAELQSYQHLGDVLAVLSAQPEKQEVLTDPVTGYVLSGFTQHITYRDKFLVTPNSGYKRFYFKDYADEPLKKYAGRLLLINQRTPKNGNSFVGAVSRHWHTDLFKRMELFYPDSLIEHVKDRPDRFDLLFERNGILLYQIR